MTPLSRITGLTIALLLVGVPSSITYGTSGVKNLNVGAHDKFVVPGRTYIPSLKCWINFESWLDVVTEIDEQFVRVSYTRKGAEGARKFFRPFLPRFRSKWCHTNDQFRISKLELNIAEMRYESMKNVKDKGPPKELDDADELFAPHNLLKRPIVFDGRNISVGKKFAFTLQNSLHSFVLNPPPKNRDKKDSFVRGSECFVMPGRGELVTQGFSSDKKEVLVTYTPPVNEPVLGCPKDAKLKIPTEELVKNFSPEET